MEIGNFAARPVSYQFGQTGTKKTEMVTITFVFVEGPNEGKRISYNGYFTDKTAKRTMDSLEYCGWDGVSLKTMTGFGSRNVELVVEMELNEKDGKEYPRVAWVNRLIHFGPATVYTDDEVDSLDSRLAALNAERKKENAERRGEAKAPDPFRNG